MVVVSAVVCGPADCVFAMILILTTSYCFTTNALVKVFERLSMPVFSLNIDRYWEYKFLFSNNQFEIINAKGDMLRSRDVRYVVSYKARLPIDEEFHSDLDITEVKWVRSTLNYVVSSLVRWAIQHSCLKLWTPYELLYPKTLQMDVAKKFFSVPEYNVHWGFAMNPRNVIVKPLVGRPLEDGASFYAKVQDVNSLSSKYPWFTQEIATGNRDATVLFVNGRVHPYKFATERGALTDWRVTQGSAANRWERWSAGDEFESKVQAFMQEMGLKFGRLDFIIGGEKPQFLEVNPCGQFGWLDDEELTLHKEVAEAILDPSSIITLEQ